MNPFDRRWVNRGGRIGRGDPLEAALRDSLAANAGQAPDADAVTERILAAADRPPATGHAPRNPWRTWGLPIVAAASVVAVVGTAVALSSYHPHTDGAPAVALSSTPSVRVPSTATPTHHPRTSTSSSSTSSPTSGTTTPLDSSTLHHVHVLDLTFTGEDDGWGLASADCITGSGTCSAIIRTTDGTHWQSHPNTPFNVPAAKGDCAAPCVRHIRFATDRIGYAYGPEALFMTTDGANSWVRQAQFGADTLETLDGNVILVSIDNVPHPVIERAPIGSSSWTEISLPGGLPGQAVLDGQVWLSRSIGLTVLAATYYDPAKGNGVGQRATIYTSTDDGASWTGRGDPCPSVARGTNDDTAAVTTAADGAVIVDCGIRSSVTTGNTLAASTISSTDGGSSYSSLTRHDGLDDAELITAADSRTVLTYSYSAGLQRTTDGGATWSHVDSVPDKFVVFVGFESDRVGRIVSHDGNTIWTTRDAGASWTKVTLG